VDGTRSVADLARDCGFTMYEAGLVVVALVQAGLLEVEEPEHDLEPEDVEPETARMTDPRQIAASLAAAFEGFGVPDQREPGVGRGRPAVPRALPGHATASDDIFGAPVHPADPGGAAPAGLTSASGSSATAAACPPRRRRRPSSPAPRPSSRRPRQPARPSSRRLHGEDHVAEVVDLGEVRAASEAEAVRLDEQAASSRLPRPGWPRKHG
jgi:hypothetical protein